MGTPKTVSETTKDMSDLALYEFMFERKWIRGFNWQQVSDVLQLGISGNSCQKKYQRLCDKTGMLYRPKKLRDIPKKESPLAKYDESQDVVSTTHHKGKKTKTLTDIEIMSISYGQIHPTLITSDLSHDDWINKYIMYDYYTVEPEGIAELQDKWNTEYLHELRNKVWDMDELLVLLPRGYGKTESVLALFIRWVLEVREPLYIVSPSYNHNKNILRRMERLLKSPAIRRDYGDIVDKVSYDKEMLTISYHPSVGYISFDQPVSMTTWNGAKEGPHPAWIVFEDVMQKDFKNIESNEDIKWKYSKTFAKMRTRRGSKRTKVTVTGTRYGMEDMYSYFELIQGFPVLHKRALNEDNTWLYCPNYTLQDLLIEREKDVPAFETTMNNNPVPSTGIYFDRDKWMSTTYDLRHEQGVMYYLVMDPARGMSRSADNTAILVVGIHNGKATVVDGYVGKIDDDAKVLKLNTFYATYNPVHTVIEKTFAQIDMNRFAHLRGLVPYQDTVKKAKIMRISAMRPFFTDGLISVLEGIQPYDFIYNEYLAYSESDSTGSRKDDAIDALSMIIQLFGQYMEKYTETQVDWSKVGTFHLEA